MGKGMERIFKNKFTETGQASHNNTSWHTDTDGFLEHSRVVAGEACTTRGPPSRRQFHFFVVVVKRILDCYMENNTCPSTTQQKMCQVIQFWTLYTLGFKYIFKFFKLTYNYIYIYYIISHKFLYMNIISLFEFFLFSSSRCQNLLV